MCFFYYFAVIFTLRRAWPFICKKKKNLNHLHPRMLYAKIGRKWPNGKKILKSFKRIFTISKLSPLREGHALHLDKLESPSPIHALCQVWLKLTKWFWGRRRFKVFNVFLLFHNYLSFEMNIALHSNKPESPLPIDFKLGWNWPNGSEEEVF